MEVHRILNPNDRFMIIFLVVSFSVSTGLSALISSLTYWFIFDILTMLLIASGSVALAIMSAWYLAKHYGIKVKP